MKPRLVNDRYQVTVPDSIADWDAPSAWERTRFESMEDRLCPGMTLFDIGTEWGWQSAIYAGFVGGGSMVLVEPETTMWPNIRLTWEANHLTRPMGCVQALVGDAGNPPEVAPKGWPDCADGPESATPGSYRYLCEPDHVTSTPVTTIDFLADVFVPDAITIDVEGAEVAVLCGAAETLSQHRPLVWVSAHPELMARNYATSTWDLVKLMASVGYSGRLLGVDHEAHWLFTSEKA